MFGQVSYSAVAEVVQRHFYFPILCRPNVRKKYGSIYKSKHIKIELIGYFLSRSSILVPFAQLKLPSISIVTVYKK